jgi:hypothetical protein
MTTMMMTIIIIIIIIITYFLSKNKYFLNKSLCHTMNYN